MKKDVMKHYKNLTNIEDTSLGTLEKAIVKGFGFAIGAGIGFVIVFMFVTMGIALI